MASQPPGEEAGGLHPERVPGSERAEIPHEKIRYLLDSPGKRRFFREILGFGRETADHLASQLAGQLPKVPGRFSMVNPAGRPHWVALVQIAGPRRTATVFTVWQVFEPTRAAFVTARPVKERDRLLFE